MKAISKILITAALLIVAFSCYKVYQQRNPNFGSVEQRGSYSPLDTYVNTMMQRSKDSAKETRENMAFLDSINRK